jgi:DNA-binding transcriptional LysR family regulator
VALVERSGRGVRLTEAGQLVAGYGRRSQALFEECRSLLDDLVSGRAGRLTLGATVTTSIFQLPAWLRELRRRQTGIDVLVHTGTSQVVETAVVDRQVDLGIVTTPAESRDLATKTLYREHVVLVVAAEQKRRAPVLLEHIGLISFPRGNGFRSYLDDKLGAPRMAACTKMESDSLEAIKSFVTAGLGGAFLPLTAVRADLDRGTLTRARVRGLPRLTRATSLIRRRDRPPTTAVRLFLDVLGAR